jgi:hypothetical protein
MRSCSSGTYIALLGGRTINAASEWHGLAMYRVKRNDHSVSNEVAALSTCHKQTTHWDVVP